MPDIVGLAFIVVLIVGGTLWFFVVQPLVWRVQRWRRRRKHGGEK